MSTDEQRAKRCVDGFEKVAFVGVSGTSRWVCLNLRGKASDRQGEVRGEVRRESMLLDRDDGRFFGCKAVSRRGQQLEEKEHLHFDHLSAVFPLRVALCYFFRTQLFKMFICPVCCCFALAEKRVQLRTAQLSVLRVREVRPNETNT